MTRAGTKLAGVVGWPISHSLSPVLHDYWLAQLAIDGAYVPLAVRREDFAYVVRALMLVGFAGVNVTVPHKEAAQALAHRSDSEATRAGAANLLIFHANGEIEARNTDLEGLVASLREAFGKTALKGKRAVLLGAGGAARASVLALDAMGAGEIAVLNRTRPRADAMALALRSEIGTRLSVHEWKDWPQIAASAALLVNATSAGMKGADPLKLSLAPLKGDAAVCDLVYNPVETNLLKEARSKGLKTVNGLSMLIHQAVPSFEAFFGVRPRATAGLKKRLEAPDAAK